MVDINARLYGKQKKEESPFFLLPGRLGGKERKEEGERGGFPPEKAEEEDASIFTNRKTSLQGKGGSSSFEGNRLLSKYISKRVSYLNLFCSKRVASSSEKERSRLLGKGKGRNSLFEEKARCRLYRA